MKHLLGHSPNIRRPPLCGAWVYRGDEVLEDLEGVDCQECLEAYAANKAKAEALAAERAKPGYMFWQRVEGIAHFGDDYYGEIMWGLVALGTLGLGIPVVLTAKLVCHGLLKLRR